jgi:glycosyltransferase involved in cell wall biosynthesis
MRVLLTADPYLPVPPVHDGGIERMVDLIARGLAARGHEVSLVAHPDSRIPGTVIPYGVGEHRTRTERAMELWQLSSALWSRRDRVDVVHSFGRMAGLLWMLPLRRVMKVQSWSRDLIPWRSVAIAASLGGDSIRFTACGTHMYAGKGGPQHGRWSTIGNAVELERFPFVPAVPNDAPLVFLGRIEPMKGAHHAIAVARAAGRRLVIAGTRDHVGGASGYFEREIAPHLDGDRVTYIGPVDDRAKAALLGGGAALLMLIDVEEAFGLVMIEAMACGTPVIAFRRGAVPEVVRDGVTGVVCTTVDDAIAGVPRALALDRGACRSDVAARFTSDAIVGQYEQLYETMRADAPRRAR